MAIEAQLSVLSIYPDSGGGGAVTFSFLEFGSGRTTTIEIDYADADNPTDGVKEAAGYLAELADALGKEARALAK